MDMFGKNYLKPIDTSLPTTYGNFYNYADHMFDRMNRIFDIMNGSLIPTTEDGTTMETKAVGFRPPMSVEDEGENLVVKVDLPGLKKDDIQVSLTKSELTVSGERKKVIKDKSYTEATYGSFCRSVKLPVEIDSNGVSADYTDGVLRLVMKKAQPSPKSISVNIK